MHPWHDVDPAFELPKIVRAVIEISRGTKAKYEIDKKTGLLYLDRVLFSAVHYPINYGFVPRTVSFDGDPLDILVYSQIDIEPRSLVLARIVGVMRMIDSGVTDDKLIAVAHTDPAAKHINDLDQLPPFLIAELKAFFEDYTNLEEKHVIVPQFLGKAGAKTTLFECLERYKKEYPIKDK